MWLFKIWWLGLISIGIVIAQLERFSKHQTISEYGDGEVHSFVINDYGYFVITGGYNGGYNCLQGYSFIYKYNNDTQEFIKIYTFNNSYITLLTFIHLSLMEKLVS